VVVLRWLRPLTLWLSNQLCAELRRLPPVATVAKLLGDFFGTSDPIATPCDSVAMEQRCTAPELAVVGRLVPAFSVRELSLKGTPLTLPSTAASVVGALRAALGLRVLK
jgi:hypothetical protein